MLAAGAVEPLVILFERELALAPAAGQGVGLAQGAHADAFR